jgi:hypothetical protein
MIRAFATLILTICVAKVIDGFLIALGAAIALRLLGVI